jgi:hypothetical protein
MSMTNYADVDEKSSSGGGGISSLVSNFPMQLKAHPFMEKPKRPKNDGKPVRPLLDVRNSRLDEISKGGFGEIGGGAHGKLANHDPSRTL